MAKKITQVERGLIGFYLDLLGVKHSLVQSHCQRVGLYSARVAKRLHKDAKAAYLGGIFHDIGKALLDGELFSGRDVDAEEYKKIQEHAKLGHEALKKRMMFTSLCCGLHHAMGSGGGYGLKVGDIPKGLSPRTVKKILEISEIISICDFIDAFTTRKTGLKDKQEGETDLRSMLVKRFPESEEIINTALDVVGDKVSYKGAVYKRAVTEDEEDRLAEEWSAFKEKLNSSYPELQSPTLRRIGNNPIEVIHLILNRAIVNERLEGFSRELLGRNKRSVVAKLRKNITDLSQWVVKLKGTVMEPDAVTMERRYRFVLHKLEGIE